MAKMSTTAKVLTVAAVGTGIYLVARSAKAEKKTEKKNGNGGVLPPSNGGGKKPSNGKKPGTTTPQAPPFPAEKMPEESGWANQIHGEWAGEDAEADAAAIQNGELSFDQLTRDLTDIAFVRVYPDGPNPQAFPENWSSSETWTQWAQAWNRIHDEIVVLVSQTLSMYGV